MSQANILSFQDGLPRRIFNRARLKEARLAKQWSQTELAERSCKLSVETISNLEAGTRQPGPETLAHLCEALGFPAAYFSASDSEGGELESPVFFRSYASKTKRQNLCLDVWRTWAGRLLTLLARHVNLPAVRLPSANWVNDDSTNDIIEQAEALATECRMTWGLGNGPLADTIRLAESMGICVVRLELKDMDEVDGFSCWQDGRPMIFLVAKKSAARERLNLAHEILHLIAHRQIPIDSLADKNILRRIENQAFAFGGALLLPRQTYAREIYSLNIPQLTQLKRRWGVSIAAQGKRCRDLGIMDEDRYTQFRKNLSWNHFIKTEPLDDSLVNESPMMMKQAIEMLEANGALTARSICELTGLPAENLSMLTGIPDEQFSYQSQTLPSVIIQMRPNEPELAS